MVLDLGISDKVKQLRREGPQPNERLLSAIVRAGAAARPALIALAIDTDLLWEDEPECYAPLHALRLLGEVGTTEMIEPLLGAQQPEPYDQDDHLPRMWLEEMPQMLARLGAPAIEPLWALVDNDSYDARARNSAMLALGYITALAPETRTPIVASLRERLATDDANLRSYVVMALGNLGVSEAYGEVMALYRARAIDTKLIPAGAARQLLLSPSAKRLACALHPLAERYQMHPLAADEER